MRGTSIARRRTGRDGIVKTGTRMEARVERKTGPGSERRIENVAIGPMMVDETSDIDMKADGSARMAMTSIAAVRTRSDADGMTESLKKRRVKAMTATEIGIGTETIGLIAMESVNGTDIVTESPSGGDEC
jgi:hypothetical protein